MPSKVRSVLEQATDLATMTSARYLLKETEKKPVPHGETLESVTDFVDIHIRLLEEMQPTVGKGSLLIDLMALKIKVERPF